MLIKMEKREHNKNRERRKAERKTENYFKCKVWGEILSPTSFSGGGGWQWVWRHSGLYSKIIHTRVYSICNIKQTRNNNKSSCL